MKKFMKSILVASMALSFAGCSKGEETSSKGLNEWHTYQTLANEMSTWNVLYSQGAAELNVLSNCVDGLLTHDTKGGLKACLAETWETNEDATVWTFHLRKGVQWVDYTGEVKGELTSKDFVTGLEYVLNYNKNGGANASMAFDTVAGSLEYYEGTKNGTLDEDDFLSTVSIETPDDYTIVYTMSAPKTYFDTLGTYSTFYPLSQGAVDEYGDEMGTDYDAIYYCGPYICSEYVNKNSKTLIQNPTWWNTEDTRFDKVTVSMVEDSNKAWELFRSGEVDHIELNETAVNEIYNAGESHEYYKYLAETKPASSYFMAFNFDSKLEGGADDVNWNTAVANKDFRLVFTYGLDWTDYLKRINKIHPEKCINNIYTDRSLAFTSDGTDYTELAKEKLGYEEDGKAVHARYDVEKANEHKEKAMEALKAQGVTFPVTATYTYKAGDSVAADTAAVLKQMLEEQLGTDFITVEFRTYSESFKTEIREPELFSFFLSGWGADFGDPISYLDQMSTSPNAFYNAYYCEIPTDDADFVEYNKILAEANETYEKDARFDRFADAEKVLIESGFILPVYTKVVWQITKVNDYSKVTAKYGIQGNRYLNWETTTNTAFTSEEYAAFEAK